MLFEAPKTSPFLPFPSVLWVKKKYWCIISYAWNTDARNKGEENGAREWILTLYIGPTYTDTFLTHNTSLTKQQAGYALFQIHVAYDWLVKTKCVVAGLGGAGLLCNGL